MSRSLDTAVSVKVCSQMQNTRSNEEYIAIVYIIIEAEQSMKIVTSVFGAVC